MQKNVGTLIFLFIFLSNPYALEGIEIESFAHLSLQIIRIEGISLSKQNLSGYIWQVNDNIYSNEQLIFLFSMDNLVTIRGR